MRPSTRRTSGGRGTPSRWRAAAPGVVAALVAALAALASACSPGADERVPRVILICVDTLRADRLGAYGYDERPLSPHLDALAREGVLFERCIAAAPWTTPSVMSLLSACYPTTHGLTTPIVELRLQVEGGLPVRAIGPAQATLAGELRAAGFATAAFTGGVTVPPELGFGRGFDRYDTSMFKLGERNVAPMLRWIDEHADEPGFLFWHTFEVHGPYLDTSYLHEVLSGGELQAMRARLDALAAETREAEPDMDGVSAFFAEAAEGPIVDPDTARRVNEALYCGGIRSMDAWIGRLVGHLRERGLYDDALIVVTSDHGEEFADRDPHVYVNGHGHSVHDELVHVPLILKLPGGAWSGARVAQQVRSVDVMPTILDLVGAPTPPGLDGASLRGIWSGRPAAERICLSESLMQLNESKAVRTERHTLIVNVRAERVVESGRSALPDASATRELYDRATDPGETRSLLAGKVSPDAEAQARALEQRLRTFLTTRPRPPGTVRLDPKLLKELRAMGYTGKAR
jgi:arylsulfatase A-like enzyme